MYDLIIILFSACLFLSYFHAILKILAIIDTYLVYFINDVKHKTVHFKHICHIQISRKTCMSLKKKQLHTVKSLLIVGF